MYTSCILSGTACTFFLLNISALFIKKKIKIGRRAGIWVVGILHFQHFNDSDMEEVKGWSQELQP